MEKKEDSKPWQNWALLGWMFVFPSTVLSLIFILLVHYPWFYAVPMAVALSLMAWAWLLRAMFS